MNYLIVGLGNPGPKYELTRHNAGFLVLDELAQRGEATFATERHGEVCVVSHRGRKLHLLKPSTFMNLSGKAVSYWMQQIKVPLDRLLIITDDVALPYGKLRLRPKGSNGGHNGLGHIQEIVGTDAYPRLRFGVGGDFPKGAQVDYVLGRFSETEMADLDAHLKRAADCVQAFSFEGLARAMNTYN